MSAKQQRQGLRLSVQNAYTSIGKLQKDATAAAREQLKSKEILLQSYLSRMEAFDDKIIESLATETEVATEIASIRKFNDFLLEKIAELSLISAPQQNGVGSSANASFAGGIGYDGSRVKLPRLEIPPFEGNPIRWQEFWDAFEAAIHSRSDLHPVDKLTYLRGFLKGEAFQLVEGFRVTEANYDSVVDLLTKRFGDKQAVIFAHVDAILSIAPATCEAPSLLEMHSTLERHLRSLDSLKPDHDSILYSIVLSKLPRSLKIEAHRKRGDTDWSFARLREWLQDEIRAREMGERLHTLGGSDRSNGASSNPKLGKVYEKFKSSKKDSPSASSLVSQTKKFSCPFCNSSHAAEQCTRYPDTMSRRTQLVNRCFSCLRKGHTAKECRSRRNCHFCQRKGHHPSLCFTQFGKITRSEFAPSSVPSAVSISDAKVSTPTPSNEKVANYATSFLNFADDRASHRTVMQTAVVRVVNSKSSWSVNARILFDTGASRSFITLSKRREMALPTLRKEQMAVSTFQGTERSAAEYEFVQFGIKCKDDTVFHIEAAVVPTITCPIQKVPVDPKSLPLPKWVLAEPLVDRTELIDIDILVGMDFYHSIILGQRIQIGPNLFLISSKVGYVVSGQTITAQTGPDSVAVMFLRTLTTPSPVEEPKVDLARYWELEEIGIKETKEDVSANEEAIRSFSETVTYDKKRYHACWPWKSSVDHLHNNRSLSYGRLKTLLNRLAKLPELRDAYHSTFLNQLKLGMIENAPQEDPNLATYYMPHQAVLNPDRPSTKLRVVFDASSKVSSDVQSLNECLHRGPILMQDICGLLLRFRLSPVAVTSDIEKAFLQIGLQESHRDVTRFFWVVDPKQPPAGSNLVTYRFCRVPFGIISSPFVLAATIRYHLKASNSQLAQRILRDIYVDNIITGETSVSEALTNYQAAKCLFREASMNLRQWYSNSSEFLSQIPEEDRGQGTLPKVLGLKWDTVNDVLKVNPVRPASSGTVITKRSILKTLPQIFDPCGFMSPVVLNGKLLIQDLWVDKIGWDEPVSQVVVDKWLESVLPSLQSLSALEVPRFVGLRSDDTLHLHVFCDASQRACAVAVYLRRESASHQIDSKLLMSKTRLAPVKQKATIPRLELVSVVPGCRSLSFVDSQLHLKIDRKVLWTDSQCVLHWIQKEQLATRFVENRVKEIRRIKDVEFRFVPSQDNPADLPTRGCDTDVLQRTSTWWKGPSWLSNDETFWPESIPQTKQPQVLNEECTSECNVESSSTDEPLIDAARCSSLGKLLRVTAYIFRFLHNARRQPDERLKAHLRLRELKEAQTWWIRKIQREQFVSHQEDKRNIKLMLQKLGVFRDEVGILRCKGRITHSGMAYNTCFPILLPSRCRFVELLVMSLHLVALHTGVNATLSSLRQSFWVLRGRSTIKRTLQDCRVCRRYGGGSYQLPPPPPLPKFRIAESSPFTHVGLDYMGPGLVKRDDTTLKTWICLYTCTVTRAVYLDVVSALSVEEFMLSLKRFVATHGVPTTIVSDNGTQFKAAARNLQKFLAELQNSDELQAFGLSNGIDWRFIPEMAPWMGGFYERLVGVAKSALRKSLQTRQISLTELQTLACEITAVMNSRPLTHMDDDQANIPVTPMQLLSPMRNNNDLLLPSPAKDADFSQLPQSKADLLIRFKKLRGMISNFWKSWRSQYLTSLRERWMSMRQRGASAWEPKVGTVVHLREDLPRCRWKLGRICELHSSADGNIRSASVRVGGGKILRRPLKLIFPLELDCDKLDQDSQERSKDNCPPKDRATRQAAERARMLWRQQLDSVDSSSEN